MRNLLMTALFLLSFSITGFGQATFGVKAGVSPAVTPNTSYIFANRETPRDEFTFNILNVNNGIYLGGFTQVDMKPFFFRFEALYNQYQIDYSLNYTFEVRGRSAQEKILTEQFHRIDIPASVGVNLGAFEVNSGVVAHFNLSQDSELSQVDGYQSNLSAVELGWQTGIGINLANVNLGLTYQMDFNNYGSHMKVNEGSLEMSNSPTRLIATIAYKF